MRKPLFRFIFLIIWFISTGFAHSGEKKTFKLKIMQNGKFAEIDRNGTIKLKRDMFYIIYQVDAYNQKENKYYAMRVAAAANPQVQYFEKNTSTSENSSPFSMGKGLASEAGRYKRLYLSTDAHHYLMYDPENSENQRGRLLRKTANNKYEMMWQIHKIRGLREYSAESYPFSRIYFVFFYDENLDSFIEDTEIIKLTVEFTEPAKKILTE